MNTAEASGRPPLASRWLAGIALALGVVIAVAAGLVAWDRREAVYASYDREMSNLAIALAEEAARSVQAVDLVLRETQSEVLVVGATDDPAQVKQAMTSDTMLRFLLHHTKNLPQAGVVALVDDKGQLVNASRPWPAGSASFAGSDWYKYLRENDDPGVAFGRPLRAQQSGEWTFVLARRINGPHHQFLGAVLAGIEERYFEAFYRAISLHKDGSIALFERDGTLLARYPHVENRIGKRLPPAAGWFAAVRRGGGSFRSWGFVDGVPRIVTVRPLRDYPLVVAVTIGEAAVVGEWQNQLWLIAGGALGLAVAVAVLLGSLVARSRRLERHGAELATAAAALRESEVRFRSFALTSSDWLWETDEHHRFAYVSDGVQAFGFGPGNLVGRTRMEIAAVPDAELEKWAEHLALLDRHEPFRDFVYAWKNSGGGEGVASVGGDPMFDAAGRFVGYRGTGRDITKQAFAEDALRFARQAAEAANYAKTQFLANVSHELRTPLNAILGFSEMLELGLVGPLQAQQLEYVGLILQSGNHLHDVINDILDFAKVDAGKFDLHEDREVDAHRVNDACFALVRERAKLGQLQLSASFDEPLPLLIVDETRLKQILLNLLSNAIKFTAAGGSVVMAVRRTPDGGVAFAVSDTGTGMTPDELKIAMEPFGQVDAGLARSHEGTGLGLPLARRLAEMHGGSLSIESEKGRGTVVTLALPAPRVMANGEQTDRAAA